jgi:microcystin-dependent protein
LPHQWGGGGQPVDNDQPSLALNYIINTSGNTADGTDQIGEVIPFLGDYAPEGYMLADGQALNILQNQALYNALDDGTLYGQTATTFNLPNLTGRTIIGAGGQFVLGETFGQDNVTIASSNLPSPQGSHSPFVNVQPSLALTYLISTTGLFPSAAGSPSPNTQYLGEVIAFAGDDSQMLAHGWMEANGQQLSVSQYQSLFSLLGTTYGGNGFATFDLPDLVGQTIAGINSHVGAGAPGSLGTPYGSNNVTLTPDQADLPVVATTTLHLVHTGPTVTAGGPVNYSIGGTASALDSTLTVSDPDSGGNLTGATVSIGAGFVTGDVLNFANQHGITGTYDAVHGVLSLVGTDTLADYQAALESITFSATDSTTGSRAINWMVTDGSASNGTSTAASSVNVVNAPVVQSIHLAGTSPTSASSEAFTVTFSKAVTGVDASDFTAVDGNTVTDTGITVSAVSASVYTVTVNGVRGNGILGLDLNAGGTGIQDTSGNPIVAGFTTVDVYTIEQSPPTVTSVDVPDDATYIAGQNLDFTAHFNEAVTVTGTPEIAFRLDTGGIVDAQYISGSGTSALTFRYTVVSGESDTNGVALAHVISLNGGTLTDGAGNDAVLTLNHVASTTGVLVDSIAPTVASVVVPADATYGSGHALTFTVNFSENVEVTTGGGTPYINLTLDTGGTVHAAYTGGSGSNQLTFAYTVASGNDDTNGVSLGNLIVLNAGAITDLATNAAALTLNSVASTANVLVDAIPPTVTSIDTVDPSVNNLSTLHFALTFSTPVTGLDLGDLDLSISGTVSSTGATITGSGANWTVTLNGVSGDGTLRLNLDTQGHAITDSFGNTLTAGHTGDQSYTIDHTAPVVTSVAVPANGTYVAGQDLDFTATFSQAVYVTGTPRVALTLDTGGTVYATYVSGSGTDKLTFTDVVMAGQQDLTGITTASVIDLNGGTIQDAATNNATLTLTGEPSTAGVNVDAIVPVVSSVSVPTNRTYASGADLDFTVNFTKTVIVDSGAGGTPFVELTLDDGGTVIASYLSGSGSSALTFRYVVAPGEFDGNGVALGTSLVLNGATIEDAAGNDTATTLNSVASTTGVLVDSILPTVTAIDIADSAVNNLHTEHFTVSFSKDVSLHPPDTSDFTLHTSGTVSGTIGSVTAVNGSTFTVTVTNVNGDGTLGLDLNTAGTAIADALGNLLTAPHSGDQAYTIEHTPPGAPIVVLTQDTGSSNSDGITRNPAITVTPAESGGTLLYKVDGALSFSTTAPNFATNGTADGSHMVVVEQQDAAGNIGASTTLNFVLDTTAPVLPANEVSLAHDTGISNTDHITNDPSLVFLPAAAGYSFLFKVDNGSYSATLPASFPTDHSADGLHTISVEEVDTAGNVSAPVNFSFTLDTIAPVIAAVTATPSNGVEGVGESLSIVLAFGEAVTLSGGTPTLSLNDNGVVTYDAAATAALNDPHKLVFDYTISSSDTVTSPLAVTGINLHGAAIDDLAGNVANLSNVATTFNGLGVDPSPAPVHTPNPTMPLNDFDGDGHSDILWQNADGTPAVWLTNGTSLLSGSNVGFDPGTNWHEIGSGDFNGDGKSDILWQNTDGTIAEWFMNGTQLISGGSVAFNPGSTWHAVGSGDFNGDGKSDILWQNNDGTPAVWLMNGLNILSGTNVGFNPGPSWHVIAAADFNGDGKADILWQNADGTPAIWLMDGTNLLSGANVGFNPGPEWHVVGAGDFNGDGKADILWQNRDGTPAVWLMNGTNLISGANVGFNPGADWHVVNTGDYNGDGKADMVWQNKDGTPAVWLMNGTSLISGANVGFDPGSNWHVIPQHHDLLV